MEEVAIIIPVYNDASRLDSCLQALSLQSYPQSHLCVYVVDNNSTVDIASVVQKYHFAKYLKEETPGSYSARNKALGSLDKETYVGFTDSDCIPDVDWVMNAVTRLERNPLSTVGGKVKVFSLSKPPNSVEHYEMLFGFPQKTYVQSDNFAVTANLFTTREVIDLVGTFNTRLYSGGDAEYGNRMAQHGVHLDYAEDVTVEHPARNSMKQLTNKIKRTVGGCYQQREVNPVMAQSFTTMALLKGFIPPLRVWRELYHMGHLPVLTKCKVGVLAAILKYRKALIKVAYKLRLIRSFERF